MRTLGSRSGINGAPGPERNFIFRFYCYIFILIQRFPGFEYVSCISRQDHFSECLCYAIYFLFLSSRHLNKVCLNDKLEINLFKVVTSFDCSSVDSSESSLEGNIGSDIPINDLSNDVVMASF